MADHPATLGDLVERARARAPIHVAVIAADQGLVLQTVQEAVSLGLIEPRLIGDPDAILACASSSGLDIDRAAIHPAMSEADAARAGVDLVRSGDADAVMKGRIHSDAFMRALLDPDQGLRLPGRR
ncbi:MAG: phosphate acetyl/butaryl transferase, partial [Bauldia litoralis]